MMVEWQQILKEGGGYGVNPGGGVSPTFKAPPRPVTPTPGVNMRAWNAAARAVPVQSATGLKAGTAAAKAGTTAAKSPGFWKSLMKSPPSKFAKKHPTATKGAIATSAAASGITLATLLSSIGRAGSMDRMDDEDFPMPTQEIGSSPDISEIAMGAAGGATVGGLGSLLYGKLKDKPDLQRDVILALVGAAAGGAIPMMKTGSMEKEAEPILLTVLTIAAILAAYGGSAYQQSKYQKQNMKMMADQQKALESIERAKLQEAARGRKALTHGAVGALGGGAIGGTLSNVYGKKTGRESLRRDIMSALAGAGLGGAAGLYSAAKA